MDKPETYAISVTLGPTDDPNNYVTVYFDFAEREQILNNPEFGKGLFRLLAEQFEEKVLPHLR